MGDIIMECGFPTCNLGAGETVWKTASLPAIAAVSSLNSHTEYHKQLYDKITVWEDKDTMELTYLECTLPNCITARGWVTPFMIQEDAVLALKHHELTYHTVPDTMKKEEREHSQEGRLGMIIMKCEACGYSTQGYKKGRLKKRLETHLSKCTVATPSERMVVKHMVRRMEGEPVKKQPDTWRTCLDQLCSVEGCVYLTLEKGDRMCFGHMERKTRLGHTNRLAVNNWLDESNTLRTEVEILPSDMRQLHKIEELAEFTNHEEQPEPSPEDRDPPVHGQHESQAEKVHNVAKHVVPVATDTELGKTGQR
jgi:hypothetical protein